MTHPTGAGWALPSAADLAADLGADLGADLAADLGADLPLSTGTGPRPVRARGNTDTPRRPRSADHGVADHGVAAPVRVPPDLAAAAARTPPTGTAAVRPPPQLIGRGPAQPPAGADELHPALVAAVRSTAPDLSGAAVEHAVVASAARVAAAGVDAAGVAAAGVDDPALVAAGIAATGAAMARLSVPPAATQLVDWSRFGVVVPVLAGSAGPPAHPAPCPGVGDMAAVGDELDADRLPTPRADGDREALRILLTARQELTTASTAQTNRLRALLLGGDDTDRQLARGRLSEATLAGLARRRPPRDASREQAVRHAEIRRLTLALREAARELKANRAQLQTIVNDVVPGLTDRRGIGPVSAAQAIVSFSHPGRCRNDAAFAALAGTSPLEASSGRTVRHRLNRGGDRALNRAIHTIAATRMRCCPTTQAYVARRTAQGKTPKEIRRCLKRYIARQLYRTLTTAMTPAAEHS